VNIGERIANERPYDLVKEILGEIDYQSWLQETAGSPEQAEMRQSNVQDLTDWIKRMQRNEPSADLADIVSHMALIGQLDKEKEEDFDTVSMMTLHAAKGLEFPYVYIAGVEEELLPHQNSLDEDGEYEERRLFYVGITRAMKELALSWARTRKRHGQMVDRSPSRFLDELPQGALEWQDAGRINDDVGRAHIDNIRALLD
jgi:ATP-dependent DNA helicase Rep